MGQWVTHTIHDLRTRLDDESGGHNDGSLLVSAITVVCVAHETTQFNVLSERICGDVAELLKHSYQTNPNEQGSCPAFEALVKHLPTVQFG